MSVMPRRSVLALTGASLSVVLGGCASNGQSSTTTRSTRRTIPAGYDIEIVSYAKSEHTVAVKLKRRDGEALFEETVTVGAKGGKEYDEVLPSEPGEYVVTARLDGGTETTFSFTLDPGLESHFRGLLVVIDGEGRLRIDPVLSD